MRSLGAKAVAGIEEPLTEEAGHVVADLLRRRHFEAARDFSSRLPVAVVSELVGVRGGGEQMLRWGTRRRSRGASTRRSSRRPTCSGCWHENPDVWDEIRRDPSLIPAAVVESVRLSSPIRAFTRRVVRDHEVGGVSLPAGARVVLVFGAANLDDERFPDAERFDVHRKNNAHVGWGNGAHTCVGIHLAKLEMRMLLEAMVPRVDRIIAGTPTPLVNNTLQGIARLPARFAAR